MKTFLSLAISFGFALLASAHVGGDVIHMTPNGFDPKTITIKVGETVTFENIDTRGRWPASNIHPTHTLYPGSNIAKCGSAEEENIFDACGAIPPGGSYSFRFTAEGVWRFHDHIFPQYSGSITVEKSNVPAPSPAETPEENPGGQEKGFFARIVDAIKNFFRRIFTFFSSHNDEPMPDEQGEPRTNDKNIDTSQKENLETGIKNITIEPYAGERITAIANNEAKLAGALESLGVATAMAKIVEESGGGSVFDCHQEAHQVGRVGQALFKEKTFEACDASCHSGCYHGAMETFLQENGTANLAPNIDRICSLFETGFEVFECLHGVGHGLLAYLDYDLPETIKECQRLPTAFDQSSCYGGVFMENIVTGQGLGARKGDHITEWVNRTDPAFPCNAISDSHDVQYQCWQMQTSWMLTINNYDFKKVSDLCLTAPADMISVCYRSYGREAAGHTLRNPQRIKELCENVPRTRTYYDDCVIGAVNVIVDFWGPGLGDQAAGLCKILDTRGKQTCYGTVAGRLSGLFTSPADRERICRGFEPAYQNLCS